MDIEAPADDDDEDDDDTSNNGLDMDTTMTDSQVWHLIICLQNNDIVTPSKNSLRDQKIF